MKRSILAIIIFTLFGIAYFTLTHPESASSMEYDFKDWPPLANDIKTRILDVTSVRGGKTPDQQRQVIFAELFKQRFRSHTPMKAIGMKFSNNTIKLLCPARMEPWEIDGVAMAAWKESRDDLGRNFDIDIFETYIGTTPIKIGELRLIDGSQPAAHITYNYPESGNHKSSQQTVHSPAKTAAK